MEVEDLVKYVESFIPVDYYRELSDAIYFVFHRCYIKKWFQMRSKLKEISTEIGKHLFYIHYPTKNVERFISSGFYPFKPDIRIIDVSRGKRIQILFEDIHRREISFQGRIEMMQEVISKFLSFEEVEITGKIEAFDYFTNEDYNLYVSKLNA